MWVMAAVAVATTAYSVYNNYSGAKDAEEAADEKTRLLEIQAQEVISRGIINRDIFSRKGASTIGAQQARMADMGMDVTYGSPLLTAEYTNAAIAEELVIMSRESEYEAMAIRNEGRFAQEQGADAARAAKISSYGSIISGAGQAYQGWQQ